MEGLIENIMVEIKKRMECYGYSDQWQICEELSRRLSEMGEDALKRDYMIDDMEGGEE